MAFYRGQPVVYIGPDFRSHPLTVRYHVNVPVPDCIYRTRSDEMIWQDTPGYLLEGIVNPIHPHIGQEMIVDKHFLRPVIEVKDQAFFTTGAPSGTKWFDNRRKTAKTMLAMSEAEFEEFLLRQTRRRAACRRMSS